MSAPAPVSYIHEWRLPSCGPLCQPRRHDPAAHDLWGLRLVAFSPPATVVRTGPLVVDMEAERVTVHGEEVRLTRRERAVLEYLAARVGQWCRAEDILADVWPEEWVAGCASPYLVYINVNRLRGRLGDAAALIATDPAGRGVSRGARRRLERVEPIS